MKGSETDPLKGLWAAVAILLVGMTVGFILISLVYTGPTWEKVLVFVAYLVVVFGLIRGVRRLKGR